jgi:hypothetical protein
MMSLRATRIKFIWGASKVVMARWRFGLWGFYERKEGLPDSGLAISLRGVLILGLCLSVTAYVGGATAIYLWLDRKENNYVTYTDVLLLPVRWDEVQEKRGLGYLDEGIANLKSQRWSDGEMKLRLGLSKYPQAMSARLALAEFYYFAQQNVRALKVLEEGMDVTPDYPGRRYLTNYFTIALQAENYTSVIDATERYLASPAAGLADKERDWLFQQKLNALIKEGRAGEALSLLEMTPDNVIFNEQRVLVLLELNRAEEAMTYLLDWRAKAGTTVQILRLQVRAYRELKQVDEMNAVLEELRQLNPADPRTYAYAVIQRKMVGDEQAARDSLTDYFFRFGGFAANTLLIAQPLAEIGAVDMLETCLQRANEQGYDLRPYLLLLAQAELKQGAWEGALQTTSRLANMSTMGRTARELDAAELARLLANIATDTSEGPQVALLKHLEKQFYVFQNYRMIVDTLMRAERYDVALEVIAQAERRYPRNQTLAVDKTKAAAILAERAAAQAATHGERTEAPVFVEDAFFQRVDAAMADKQWVQAASMIRDVQQARPSWLKSRETDVLSRQIRVARGAQALLEMSLAARLLLDGSLARSQIVVDYAVELHNQGDTEVAVLLLREVTRKTPAHALARRYLDDWTSKPEAPAETPPSTPAVTPAAK